MSNSSQVMSNSNLVMKGFLSEFNLADVLRVVAISRQFTAIELLRNDGTWFGAIWMKSGHVIAAQRGSTKGRPAFHELFRSMAEIFVVSRLEDPPTFGQPLGHLVDLLSEVLQRSRRLESSQGWLRPLPPPPLPPPPQSPAASDKAGAPRVVAPAPAPAPAEARPSSSRKRVSLGMVAPVRHLATVDELGRPAPIPEDGPGIVLAVCSPKGGVGKTTIALNLSVAVAQRGMNVLLVDADINGDQLALLAARDRVKLGVHDILDRPDALDEALRKTTAPNLRLLPAAGPEPPAEMLDRGRDTDAWREVLDACRVRADITVVDCPAGMFGTTQDVLWSASHVLGVFQSEMVAQRSFAMFMRGLSSVPQEFRPKLLGVVVNMFQKQSVSSLEAFHGLCDDADRYRLFETTIPRSEAFAEASLAGQPLRFAPGTRTGSMAWLFDMLAEEVCSRFGLITVAEPPSGSFLV